jgi:hypothetical protein
MLKIIPLAIGLSLLCGVIPAAAASSCESFCAQNRCGHGSYNPTRCMHNCVAICQEKQAKGAPKKQ